MISTVAIFVLAFAAVGLLLGFAATFDVQQEQERVDIGQGEADDNSITLEEEIDVQVESG
ncbi:hypothetical protein [Candidatus Nitrososphaera sp. FF02]|uniref:hypothetical protein n=1 Tax=Candidatus Nitrososphaera sp. FF02 TaxID=3398226 RepID=UPI0039EC16BC